MAGARQVAKRAAISNGVTAKCEAGRADAGARVCDPSHAVLIPQGKKPWSGRRESNPRMQLGKLGVSQRPQPLSCKTSNKRAQFDQRLTSEKQNPQLLDF